MPGSPGSNQSISARLSELAQHLLPASHVAVLTGAGISQESGIPTFRGPEGLWRQYRPEELATPAAFRQNPRLVWEWYDWRRCLIADKSPNPAHYALVALEARIPEFTLITQNVDGLHKLAGSTRLSEIHGNIWQVRCLDCGRVGEDRRVPLPLLPYCPECGGLLRPNVVWFGEPLDVDILNQAQLALQQAQVMLVVGTSALVQPAASFAYWAQKAGALIAEFNLEPTPLTGQVDFSFLGMAGELLPQLVTATFGA
ncbi:MAG: NAD-dependent deacylase [Deltaproteobacteria bacterium]|nr:MAG: NAD-dependent deacylase [Deltaproteobacteria bacterium]